MKKKTIFIVALFCLLCLPYQVMAQPRVLVENPVFAFETVPEGVHVEPEFVIKNSGDTVLHITDVLPP